MHTSAAAQVSTLIKIWGGEIFDFDNAGNLFRKPGGAFDDVFSNRRLDRRLSTKLFATPFSECHGVYPQETSHPSIYRFRVGTVLLAFVSGFGCAFFSLLLTVSKRTRRGDGREFSARIVRVAGGTLVPTDTSLLLPRLVYAFELVVMLLVWSLPFFPAMLAWHRPLGDLRAINHDMKSQIRDVYYFHSAALPQCGTYFDLAAPNACSNPAQRVALMYDDVDVPKWMWWDAEASGDVAILDARRPATPPFENYAAYLENWVSWYWDLDIDYDFHVKLEDQSE